MSASDPARRCALAVAVVLLTLASTPVDTFAQAATHQGDEQVRRLRLQMRQLQASMQESLARTELERDEARQALAVATTLAEREKAAVATRAAAQARDLVAVRQERETLAARVVELEAALSQRSAERDGYQAELHKVQRALGAQNAELDTRLGQCVSHNHELHELGLSLLQRYENKGIAEVLGANEPFIQRARVRLENTVSATRNQLDAHRMPDVR